MRSFSLKAGTLAILGLATSSVSAAVVLPVETFSSDPSARGWVGSVNADSFQPPQTWSSRTPNTAPNNFGYSAASVNAGGVAGEAGGRFAKWGATGLNTPPWTNPGTNRSVQTYGVALNYYDSVNTNTWFNEPIVVGGWNVTDSFSASGRMFFDVNAGNDGANNSDPGTLLGFYQSGSAANNGASRVSAGLALADQTANQFRFQFNNNGFGTTGTVTGNNNAVVNEGIYAFSVTWTPTAVGATTTSGNLVVTLGSNTITAPLSNIPNTVGFNRFGFHNTTFTTGTNKAFDWFIDDVALQTSGTPTLIPEPTALSLLGLAGLAALRRRRA